MRLQQLHLQQFRSYSEATFDFTSGINVITGPNGSGKTNILEAIYTLAFTRSFRDSPAQLARHGSDWFRIWAQLDNSDEIALRWVQREKRCEYNQQPQKPQDFFGTVPVVLFEPGMMDIVYGAPQRRRRWLDRVLSATDNSYLRALLRYKRILRQRNSLLRSQREVRDEVFGWDVLLVEQAVYIKEQREKLIHFLDDHFGVVYSEVAGEETQVRLQYRSRVVQETTYKDDLLAALEAGFVRDQRYGFTTSGPHRDDVVLQKDGQPFSVAGSRGEVRTATLALTATESRYIYKTRGEQPVVLLDDVLSELDEQRRHRLLGAVEGSQILLTTTELPEIPKSEYNHIALT